MRLSPPSSPNQRSKSLHWVQTGVVQNSAALQNLTGRVVVVGRDASGALVHRGFANQAIATQFAAMSVGLTIEGVR